MGKFIVLQTNSAKISVEAEINITYIEKNHSLWTTDCDRIAQEIQVLASFIKEEYAPERLEEKEFKDRYLRYKHGFSRNGSDLKKITADLTALDKKHASLIKNIDKFIEHANAFISDEKNSAYKSDCIVLLDRVQDIKCRLEKAHLLVDFACRKHEETNNLCNTVRVLWGTVVNRKNVLQTVNIMHGLKANLSKYTDNPPSPRSIALLTQELQDVQTTMLSALNSKMLAMNTPEKATDISVVAGTRDNDGELPSPSFDSLTLTP